MLREHSVASPGPELGQAEVRCCDLRPLDDEGFYEIGAKHRYWITLRGGERRESSARTGKCSGERSGGRARAVMKRCRAPASDDATLASAT
jgi:hypothetical protein